MELLIEDADIITMAAGSDAEPGVAAGADRAGRGRGPAAACWSGTAGSRPSAQPGRSAPRPGRTPRWCGWTGRRSSPG